ncbi:hypothetical protein IX307_001890 [Bacteroides pyogenes]|uniref:DoxX family protein n=1 Tax=Bacteroides pyogenes TaxID=310300 RepID=UPI001BAB140E|nr:hypothetical protein [Bacteroides pyogenes]MBR8705294.1 hypothetical protein [Bacteroides pyogenes]MBR8720717.1 hypothetical protein [Bacteroides pyogenes]MBR8724224.1 hypothetical protein [Bacteroides pyogenes]MBR8737439.1 hypothetical protein [Bacteroides pyogenes]MBR8753373.1 hypothetical protein [Bacteroides pyogenes]
MSKILHYIKEGLCYLLAIFMVLAGINHFTNTTPYISMVPNILPWHTFIVYGSGIVEIMVGIMLFFKGRIRIFGALLIFMMMLIFFPIHIADLFRETPSISGFVPANKNVHEFAIVRVIMQCILILWTYLVYRYIKKTIKY